MTEHLDVGTPRTRAQPTPPRPSNENERLEALYDLAILDTGPDPAFDRLTRLASAIFGTPLAFISFVDENRQWFKSFVGSDLRETSRDLAFCAYTILQDDVLVVTDASQDPRFRHHPVVRGHPGVRFYAGAPIVTAQGQNVGTICVIDTEPREPLTTEQENILTTLARLAREAAEQHQAHLVLQKKDDEVRNRYALVARTSQEGGWDWDLRKNRVFYSHRWQHILGLPEWDVKSGPEHWMERIHPEDEARVQEEVQQHLGGKTARLHSEHRIRHMDGSYRWMAVHGQVQRSRSGRAMRMAGSLTDISSDRISDALTGLPNRALFNARLTEMIARSEAQQRWDFAVLSLDVDRFQRVNERHGHAAGDAMLKGIAHRLTEVISQTRSSSQSLAARIADDEFVLLLDGVQTSTQAEAIAQRIHNSLGAPLDCEGELLRAQVSIGIVLAGPERHDPESFLRKSDLAMYQAKVNGRSLSETFDPATQEETMLRMELEQDLRHAVALQQLRLEYQPQVHLQSGALVGCEALVRWQHPHRGLLMPAEFIPVAEEAGLISSIDLWVLERSCAQLAEWRRMPGAEDLKMSVNFSAQHLPKRGLKDGVERLLRSFHLPPDALCLELTESVLDEDVEARVGLMEELRSIGVGLHMDDFGSGYSSFKQLYELPFDTLKIDRSFLDKVLDEAKARKIVEGILGLTKLIGLKVVAEGVEDSRQALLLRQMGCDFGQGFLYDRPLDAETFCKRYLLEAAAQARIDNAAEPPEKTGTDGRVMAQPGREVA